VFWALKAKSGDYGMGHICFWDRRQFSYDGVCSHVALDEGVAGQFDMSPEELEVFAKEREQKRLMIHRDGNKNWHQKQMATNYSDYMDYSIERVRRSRANNRELHRETERKRLDRARDEKTFYCPIYKIALGTKLLFDRHNAGLIHLRKAEGKTYEYNCYPCNYGTDRKALFKRHLGTASHDLNVDSYNNAVDGDTVVKRVRKLVVEGPFKYNCDLCSFHSNDKGNFTKHLLTAKHLKNIEKVNDGIKSVDVDDDEDMEPVVASNDGETGLVDASDDDGERLVDTFDDKETGLVDASDEDISVNHVDSPVDHGLVHTRVSKTRPVDSGKDSNNARRSTHAVIVISDDDNEVQMSVRAANGDGLVNNRPSSGFDRRTVESPDRRTMDSFDRRTVNRRAVSSFSRRIINDSDDEDSHLEETTVTKASDRRVTNTFGRPAVDAVVDTTPANTLAKTSSNSFKTPSRTPARPSIKTSAKSIRKTSAKASVKPSRTILDYFTPLSNNQH
jgi:hypothetical protein